MPEGAARPAMSRVGSLLWLGRSAALLLGIMVLGSLVLWIGVPLGWLWVAGRVQGATGSLGTALGVALFGVLVSIAAVVNVLIRLSEGHRAARRARGREDLGHFPLEVTMVLSAGLALAGFVVWFLFFAGASPAPVSVSS